MIYSMYKYFLILDLRWVIVFGSPTSQVDFFKENFTDEK